MNNFSRRDVVSSCLVPGPARLGMGIVALSVSHTEKVVGMWLQTGRFAYEKPALRSCLLAHGIGQSRECQLLQGQRAPDVKASESRK